MLAHEVLVAKGIGDLLGGAFDGDRHVGEPRDFFEQEGDVGGFGGVLGPAERGVAGDQDGAHRRAGSMWAKRRAMTRPVLSS